MLVGSDHSHESIFEEARRLQSALAPHLSEGRGFFGRLLPAPSASMQLQEYSKFLANFLENSSYDVEHSIDALMHKTDACRETLEGHSYSSLRIEMLRLSGHIKEYRKNSKERFAALHRTMPEQQELESHTSLILPREEASGHASQPVNNESSTAVSLRPEYASQPFNNELSAPVSLRPEHAYQPFNNEPSAAVSLRSEHASQPVNNESSRAASLRPEDAYQPLSDQSCSASSLRGAELVLTVGDFRESSAYPSQFNEETASEVESDFHYKRSLFLERSFSDSLKRLADLEKESAALAQQVSQLMSNLRSASERCSALEGENAFLLQERNALEKKLTSAEDERNHFYQQNLALQEQIRSERESALSEKRALESETFRLNDRIFSLQEEIEAVDRRDSRFAAAFSQGAAYARANATPFAGQRTSFFPESHVEIVELDDCAADSMPSTSTCPTN